MRWLSDSDGPFTKGLMLTSSHLFYLRPGKGKTNLVILPSSGQGGNERLFFGNVFPIRITMHSLVLTFLVLVYRFAGVRHMVVISSKIPTIKNPLEKHYYFREMLENFSVLMRCITREQMFRII